MPAVKATVLTVLALLLGLRALIAAVRALAAWTRPLDTPDAILLLGGSEPRERAALLAAAGAAPRPRGLDRAAAAALTSRSTPIYVSSPACSVVRVARGVGIARRVRLDECAVDTLTNFTTMLPLLNSARRVLVLTSRAHARRAAVLAWIVLGSGGVRPTVAVVRADAGEPPESGVRLCRDAVRAIAWVSLGVSGAAAGRVVHGERFRHAPRRARRLEAGRG